MRLTLEDGVEDALFDIAATGNLTARREVAKVVAFLQDLEQAMSTGSADFWNVAGSASGRLTSGRTRSDGEALWVLYRGHFYCSAVLSRHPGGVRVLAVCRGEREVERCERSLCG